MGKGGQAGSGAFPVPVMGWDAGPGGHGGNDSLDGDRNVTAL